MTTSARNLPPLVPAPRRRRSWPALILSLAVAALAGVSQVPAPASAAPAGPPPRAGELLSTALVARVPIGRLREQLAGLGVPTGDVRYGIDAYRIVYGTVDAAGHATRASGLVALPEGAGRPGRLPTVVYLHGTVAGRGEAPSRFGADEGAPVAGLIASRGTMAVLPDYLGLGDSPGPHPYVQADLEASAATDMLVAARGFAGRAGVALRRHLVVTGFSEGGQAAMAVGQRLSEHPVAGFDLEALAPVAGPYDLSGTTWPALFDADRVAPANAAFYSAYVLEAYQRRYGVFGNPRQVFRQPYDVLGPVLFSGRLTSAQVASILPGSRPPDIGRARRLVLPV